MCIVILNYVKVYAYKYIHILLYVYVYMCMYSIGICICDKSPVGIGLSMAFRHDLMHNCWWNSHVCWLHYDGSRLNHVKSCEIMWNLCWIPIPTTHPWRLNPESTCLCPCPFLFLCLLAQRKNWPWLQSIPIFSTQDNSKGLLYNRVVPHLSDLAVITINPSLEGSQCFAYSESGWSLLVFLWTGM